MTYVPHCPHCGSSRIKGMGPDGGYQCQRCQKYVDYWDLRWKEARE